MLPSSGEDGAKDQSVAAIKQALCNWTNSHMKHYKDVDNVKHIPDDFIDGKVFLALLDSVDPEKCVWEPRGPRL